MGASLLGMRRLAICVLVVGCRIDLDHSSADETAKACQVSDVERCTAASSFTKFSEIHDNVFVRTCGAGSCHQGSGAEGKLDLTSPAAYAALVGAPSQIDSSRMLVVPGDPRASYLMLMLHAFEPSAANPPGVPPPASIGYMPQGSGPLCCQKIDAIDRWITAGAEND